MPPHRVLILGGTTEARELGLALRDRAELDVELSLAGRTRQIPDQPVRVRVGGFGGTEGLAAYLRQGPVSAIVDATHPFAAVISSHAKDAAERAGVPFLALRRAPWAPTAGDAWTPVASVPEAVRALGALPRRVFLALGRQEAAVAESAPEHFYLIRSVDPIDPPLALRRAEYVLDRGPFREEAELELLQGHRIDCVVSRNSGGDAAYGKIAAARKLGLPVLMVQRPELPEAPSAQSVPDAVRWIDHVVVRGSAERGV